MAKLVVLKFTDGSFDLGFSVTLQIGEESDRPSIEITGRLPPCPEMPLYYDRWQSSYLQLGNRYRLNANKIQVTNVSVSQDCQNMAHILRARFNSWLQAEEFRPLREKWLERLLPADQVRVILQSENGQLQRLPWHLWDLLERYPKTEIALSPLNYYPTTPKLRTPKPVVKILAIVGDSQGIDTQADQAILQKCPDANVSFIVEPQRKELTDYLWGDNWDILFFAGHSSTQKNNNCGRIYLNKTDSLSIGELKYALKRAIERGLQIAIFNSCDGLGLARELVDLHIPQIIVMREPVPDQVAQEFLKYFLQSFAGGETLYQAVREARERLQGIEDRFPCATWLPVIYQNPAQIPPTWNEFLKDKIKPPNPPPPGLKRIFFSSLVITGLVCGIRFLGGIQPFELQAFDQMMRSRPDEGSDQRLLVVTIDDTDLANQRRNGEILKGTSISETSLNKLLKKLEEYQPRAIGLDIYRDFPAEQKDLKTRLGQTNNLIGVCKGSDTSAGTKGIAPPPEIPKEQHGFSDFIHDSDGVVRRHLLYTKQETASSCSTLYAFSTQLAFHYLSSLGIQPQLRSEKPITWRLGNTLFPSISPYTGGYQGIDANGSQILLNYRSSKNIAEQVSLTQFLSNPVNSRDIKNRIVLIGVTAKGDFPDYWDTPYGSTLDEQMPGVLVQAHMVSQIVSAVLDGRPLLRVWLPWLEVIWIWGWSVVGGVVAWQWCLFPRLALGVGVSSAVLYVLCFGLLIVGVWVPFVPSALGLVITGGVIRILKMHDTKLDKKDVQNKHLASIQ